MCSDTQTGTLYIVATPIGNLADMTFRAVDTLKSVDFIAAEDTRHSKRLLNHYNINTRLISCHEHNEIKRTARFISDLKSGKSIALISDAGTPTISDPGYKLVAAVAKEDIKVIPIPGCSAAIAGLSVSGLPTDTFLFVGFLPRKKNKQKATLDNLKSRTETLIVYESPRRIIKLIDTLLQVFGDRNACLTREITKINEEHIRMPLSDIYRVLSSRESIRGECTIFIEGYLNKKELPEKELDQIIIQEIKKGAYKTSNLARQISEEYSISKKRVYDRILRLSQK